MIEFDTIEQAIADLKMGKMIIVVDDYHRENEGDFVMAADKVTSEAINFMAIHGRGLICAPITSERARQLDLPMMVDQNNTRFETAFTVSVDARGVGTGISAEDRARTIRALIDENTHPEDFMRPGHIFPLVAQKRGVLQRPGHTEAAVDLARLAGCRPGGIVCEICREDGSMARVPDLFQMAKHLGLKFITVESLIEYRQRTEILIKEVSAIPFPTHHGAFNLHLFEELVDGGIHIALVKGDLEDAGSRPILTRVHSECLTGDVFHSLRCDCGEQLEHSLELIEKRGKGVLIYLRQEGRGIGLVNKIKSYLLQDQGLDTVAANHQLGFQADLRNYYFAAQVLRQFEVKEIDLITNNPRKLNDLQKFGIDVKNRIPLEISPNPINENYLQAKRDRLGHILLNLDDREFSSQRQGQGR